MSSLQKKIQVAQKKKEKEKEKFMTEIEETLIEKKSKTSNAGPFELVMGTKAYIRFCQLFSLSGGQIFPSMVMGMKLGIDSSLPEWVWDIRPEKPKVVKYSMGGTIGEVKFQPITFDTVQIYDPNKIIPFKDPEYEYKEEEELSPLVKGSWTKLPNMSDLYEVWYDMPKEIYRIQTKDGKKYEFTLESVLKSKLPFHQFVKSVILKDAFNA